MKCPYCGHLGDKVVDSRESKEGEAIRRRRECLDCGRRFTSYERIDEIPYMVIKKDGTRERFERQKLIAGLLKACEKRPVSVAALEGMLRRIAARKPKGPDVGLVERVLWFTDQFQALSQLRAAMSERARGSPTVARFVTDLDALLSRMLTNAFRERVPDERLPLAVETFRATVEGTFVKGLSKRERHKVLTFALEQLLGGGR